MQYVKWLCIWVAALIIIVIAWVGSSLYSLEAEGFRLGGGSSDWSSIAFDSYLWKVPENPDSIRLLFHLYSGLERNGTTFRGSVTTTIQHDIG